MEKTLKLDYSIINQAIDNGLNYLMSKSQSGKWRGFPTLAGDSDIWVTGFITAHIQSFLNDEERLNEIHAFLIEARQPTDGWSYSAMVPSDADSTAWCLMALKSSSIFDLKDLENSRTFLWEHFVDKGIATYNLDSGIGDFVSAPNNEAIAGWTASHPDVSVATILADINNERVPTILDWLRTLQSEEGFINSYWWRGPYYATALTLRALNECNEALSGPHAETLFNELKRLQLDDGGFALGTNNTLNPFSTALALESLLHLSNIHGENETFACAQALLGAQNDNGSWDGDFILRIPAPHVLDPETITAYDNPDGGGNSFIPDQSGLFATTMACYALNCLRQNFDNPHN